MLWQQPFKLHRLQCSHASAPSRYSLQAYDRAASRRQPASRPCNSSRCGNGPICQHRLHRFQHGSQHFRRSSTPHRHLNWLVATLAGLVSMAAAPSAVQAVIQAGTSSSSVKRSRPRIGSTFATATSSHRTRGVSRDAGVDLASAGRFDEACRVFLAHVSAMPGDSKAWEMLAQCETELGKPGRAVRCAARAVELEPEWPDAHLTLARSLCALGELVIASHSLDKCEAAVLSQPDPGSKALAELTSDISELRSRICKSLDAWSASALTTLGQRASMSKGSSIPATSPPIAAPSSSPTAEFASPVTASSSATATSALPAASASSTAVASIGACEHGHDDTAGLPPLPEALALVASKVGPAPGLGFKWVLPMPWAAIDADPELRFWRARVIDDPARSQHE
jgi:tetratricopeptide (TPR) repeat protein